MDVSFNLGALASAMKAGGPMGRDRRLDGGVIGVFRVIGRIKLGKPRSRVYEEGGKW